MSPPALRPPAAPAALAALAALAATGCHTIRITEDTARGETRHQRLEGPPRALPPRLELDEHGWLRVVEPLACAREAVTPLEVAQVRRKTPNAAALVVGVIATAAGAIALVNGVAGDDPGGSPATYLGPLGIAAGLPLVIGPLRGNTSSRVVTEVKEVRAPAEAEACGERPLVSTPATLQWTGLRAVGALDGDGRFSVSPFTFIDAFAVAEAPRLVLTLQVAQPGGGVRALELAVDASALARTRDEYLTRARIDLARPPIRKVPRLEPRALSLVRGGGPGLRTVTVSLPVDNTGPGDAYWVRAVLSSPHPELDGRVLYAGRIAAHGEATVTGVLTLSDEAAEAMARDEVVVSARLRDAYDAAPESPVRWRGKVP